MKRVLLILITALALFTFTNEVKATHLMGGEITAKQLSDSIYEITLTVYRDTLGIPMDSLANFTLMDSVGNTVMTFQTPYDTSISGNTLRLYPYGVEVYIFIDTIHLPSQGTYHLSFIDCCRNGAIQNLSSPLSENMYLTTTLTYFGNATNSTPFFLVQPVIFLPVNTTWAYNPLPFDADGDSLVWSLDTPLTKFNTACAGYTAPPSVSTNPFSLNSTTGSITWTASTVGNFDATVLVDEYRNGVKIGEIRRDMQFIVINTTSSMARMTNMHEVGKDNMGNPHVYLKAGQNYRFSFFAEDADSSDVVSMHAFGEPFMFQQGKRASFFVYKTGKTYGNEIEGLFTWKPHVSHIRNNPYIVVYRVSDGFMANDYTVLYSVNDTMEIPGPVGMGENEQKLLSVFPNPASDNIQIGFTLEDATNITVEIFDIYGTQKYLRQVNQMQEGNHLITLPLDLRSGNYIVTLKNNGQLLDYERIVIQR